MKAGTIGTESRALRRAQEAIEEHGDWDRPPPITPRYVAEELVVLAVCMGAVAFVVALVNGRLDAAAARLFAFLGW